MADFSKQITDLEDLLNSATRSVSVDGTSTQFDLEAARKRLAYLKTQDDDSIAAGKARPRVSSLKLGGAW